MNLGRRLRLAYIGCRQRNLSDDFPLSNRGTSIRFTPTRGCVQPLEPNATQPRCKLGGHSTSEHSEVLQVLPFRLAESMALSRNPLFLAGKNVSALRFPIQSNHTFDFMCLEDICSAGFPDWSLDRLPTWHRPSTRIHLRFCPGESLSQAGAKYQTAMSSIMSRHQCTDIDPDLAEYRHSNQEVSESISIWRVTFYICSGAPSNHVIPLDGNVGLPRWRLPSLFLACGCSGHNRVLPSPVLSQIQAHLYLIYPGPGEERSVLRKPHRSLL